MLTEADLVECLHKRRLPRRDALLLILSVDAQKPKEVADIKRLGRGAGMPEINKWNMSDILRHAKGLAVRMREGWMITSGGKDIVGSLNILPEGKSVKKVHFAQTLHKAAKKIASSDTVAFVEEAINCFEGGLYRSAVVLSWVGAVSLLQDQVIAHHLSTFNSEAQRRDANWKQAKIKDDLSRMKESEFLDIIGSPPVSLIGKNVKEELKNNCLQLRNACGHPSSFTLGENRVAAHLEVLILNVFSKFS